MLKGWHNLSWIKSCTIEIKRPKLQSKKIKIWKDFRMLTNMLKFSLWPKRYNYRCVCIYIYLDLIIMKSRYIIQSPIRNHRWRKHSSRNMCSVLKDILITRYLQFAAVFQAFCLAWSKKILCSKVHERVMAIIIDHFNTGKSIQMGMKVMDEMKQSTWHHVL